MSRDWPDTPPGNMAEALALFRWLPRPGLCTRPPQTMAEGEGPAAYRQLLAVTDGLVHPKGDAVIVGTDPRERARAQSTWDELVALAEEAAEAAGSDPWPVEGLRPLGHTDTGGLWLLDVSDPADADPLVWRAEPSSLRLAPAHASLSAFVGWAVCWACCTTASERQRVRHLFGL